MDSVKLHQQLKSLRQGQNQSDFSTNLFDNIPGAENLNLITEKAKELGSNALEMGKEYGGIAYDKVTEAAENASTVVGNWINKMMN